MHACVSVRVAENRQLLCKENVEKVLVELLSVADINVKTATCKAVHAMSLHQASKDTFRDLGMYSTHSLIHLKINTLYHNEVWMCWTCVFQVLSLQLYSC